MGRTRDAQAEFYETKFRGPDGVVIDVSEHPWFGAAPLDRGEVDLTPLVSQAAE